MSTDLFATILKQDDPAHQCCHNYANCADPCVVRDVRPWQCDSCGALENQGAKCWRCKRPQGSRGKTDAELAPAAHITRARTNGEGKYMSASRARAHFTRERLEELFAYDPASGALTRRDATTARRSSPRTTKAIAGCGYKGRRCSCIASSGE